MEQMSGIIAARFTAYLNQDQHWCNIFQYALQILMEKWISLTVMGILAGSLDMEKSICCSYGVYATSFLWWWISHEDICRMSGMFLSYGWGCAG